MGAASAVTLEEYFVVFLPFLRLECEKGYKVGDVEFLPLRDTRGNLPGALSGVKDPLLKILSGCLDRDGELLNNCVVATVGDHGWDLKEEDFETVRAVAAVLFLASWACNEYFPKFLGKYTNSSHFRLVGQNYTGDMPDAITVSARRRDGKKIHAGYEHGDTNIRLRVPGLESNKDPDAGFENIQRLILNAAYGVHANIKAHACRGHYHYIQPTPIVERELRPEAGRPAASRTKQTPTRCYVRLDHGCGQFHPQIRTGEKGIAAAVNEIRTVRGTVLQSQRRCGTIQPHSEDSKVLGVNLHTQKIARSA